MKITKTIHAPSKGCLVTRSATDSAALRQRAAAVAQNSVSADSKNDRNLSPEEIHKTLYELRVHQIELEMQSEELRQAQRDLYSERERYFDLYDLAPRSDIAQSAPRG